MVLNTHMETRKRRLYDMEIDEISLVDRGANQHAAIVISKAHHPEEDDVSIGYEEEVELYDEDGDPVESLEDGDVVFDDEGNAYVYSEDESADIEDYEDGGDEEVGKAGALGAIRAFGSNLKGGHSIGRLSAKTRGVPAVQSAIWGETRGTPRALRAGAHLGKHQKKYLIGGGVTAGGAGVTYGVKKSLGDVVMEELSKADNDEQRNEVIAKAVEEAEIAKAAAAEAWERVSEQEDANIESAFISKAAEYNLPVDPEDLGLILKAASTVLTSDQLDLLDQLFSGIGEVLYEEIGYEGDTDNNSVMDVVDGYVGEYIGKADASAEQISTAIFDINPEAYDAYLAENRR